MDRKLSLKREATIFWTELDRLSISCQAHEPSNLLTHKLIDLA